MPTKTIPKRQEVPKELTWDLESIYSSPEAWEQDAKYLTELLPQVSARQGTLGKDAASMLVCLQLRDQIGMILGKLVAFAMMRKDEDTTNPTNQARADRAISLSVQVSAATSFITPELLAIPEAQLREYIAANSKLGAYRHQIEDLLRQKAHVRSAEIEEVLAQAEEVASAPQRIFGMINDADIKFPAVNDSKGEEYPLTKGSYLRYLESADRELRRQTFETLHGTFAKQQHTLAATLSSHVRTDMFYAQARGYSATLEMALSEHNIPISVYDNLIATVNQNLALLHRYVSLRKRLLGLPDMHLYDLMVPMIKQAEQTFSFQEAMSKVAESLEPMGEDYKKIVTTGFTSRWIDVVENEGKRGGAYSFGAYGTHPFVLLNYQERLDDIFTLTHEMGHSLHSYHTRKDQPYHYADYTIFVAEVASTLHEALLTQHLLKIAPDNTMRLALLNHALDTYRGTLFRQTIFAEFERTIHKAAEAGEALTAEYLRTTYKELTQRYYGPEMIFDDVADIEWGRIPHFYSSFYVYQYATGISASAALAQQIITEGQPAVNRYREFLSSGSSDFSLILLKKAGVDMSTPEPIQAALNLFGAYLEEMEKIA